MSGIASGSLTNLCQSVKTPGLPVSLTIRAGREAGKPAKADFSYDGTEKPTTAAK